MLGKRKGGRKEVCKGGKDGGRERHRNLTPIAGSQGNMEKPCRKSLTRIKLTEQFLWFSES